jgi:DEAD/DEAH box helicase domain-containing protein
MLPSIVAEQVRQGLADYLRTTFEISTPLFRNLLNDFLREEGSLFRGPYLHLALPFRRGRSAGERFEHVPLGFTPWLHQEQAFERLGPENPHSTIVATGTGSGKTECFLYPVLEHCRRQQHRKGVKAVLVYPMNALATDQALRIAHIVDATPALKGVVRAGLYVGQREAAPKTTMGERHVITDRNILRQNPPDILLTNYKMLDYLLLRHQDRPLWQHNEPDTLRFLVVDELHTFDGAQGTDLACLIRRLKARLRIAPRDLCCVGTSATLGSGDNAQRLLHYAQDIFGEPFDTDALITEQRISAAEFLGEAVIRYSQPPAPEDEDALNPENHASPEEYLAAQYGLWFDKAVTPGDMESDSFRVGLGDELREHLFFQNLVRGMKSKITSLDRLLEIMRPFFPKGRGRESRYQVLALLSLLSLISHARRTVTADTEEGHDTMVLPLLSVRMQHWLRELANMVVSVEALNEETGARPRLRFSADLPEQTPCRHLPLAHCRECGAAGWAGLMDVNRSHYRTELKPIYRAFFSKKGINAPDFHFFFPNVEEAQASQTDGVMASICGSCRGVHPRTAEDGACKSCHSGNVVRVFMPNESSKNCPFCHSRNSMLLLGARAASLTSAIISLLFASRYNEDKKLIAFSDNVQDAAHRAGFIGARSFGFTLRAAIQQCLREQQPLPTLAAFPERFCEHWRTRLGKNAFIATFIHPGMEWRYHYDYLKKNGRLPSQSLLPGWIDKRLGWEIYSAYGLNARIGRTLEKTSASIAHVAPEILQLAVQRLGPVLANEFEPLRDCTPE